MEFRDGFERETEECSRSCENETGGPAKTRIEAYGKKCPVGVVGPVRALDRTLLFVYVSNDR